LLLLLISIMLPFSTTWHWRHQPCMPQEWETERALHVLLPLLLLLLLQAAAALEDLDSYPHEPEVHAYLLDRLTRVAGLEALYELHYLAITLGKV
jgi:uncharacterized membrane protein